MKTFLERTFALIVLVAVGLFLWKVAQNYCWNHNVSFLSPPSLGSWDPWERAEAARRLGKKYGGAR